MSDQYTQSTLPASILDRLIDDEPDVSYEPAQNRMVTIRDIKASVVRDLENLLNTRRHILPPDFEFSAVNDSVYVYGLRDYTSKNPGSTVLQQELKTDVEQTIARFEPRLKNVIVQVDVGNTKEQKIRFRINALLVVEPETEPVSFDTYFDVNRGEYTITE
ncbi:MAG: type VI secretion system baseplate subunit TssE [Desulfomonilia bacterium]